MRFRITEKPFDNIKLRQAVAACMDHAEILKVAFRDAGVIAENHHVSPIHPEYAKLPPLKRDIEKAKAQAKAEQKFYGKQLNELLIAVERGKWDTCVTIGREIADPTSKLSNGLRSQVLSRVAWQMLDHELADNVTAGYHAMAIDEQRKMFPVLRWNREEKRVLEVWFAGVHSDIGGGYERRGLSNIALQWMIYRAAGHGLLFKSDLVTAATKRPSSRIHDSLTGGWKLLGSRGRKLRQTDWIHESVHKKLKRSPGDYHPANLPPKLRYWPPVAKG